MGRPSNRRPVVEIASSYRGVVKYYLAPSTAQNRIPTWQLAPKRQTGPSGSTVSALRETATRFTRRGWLAARRLYQLEVFVGMPVKLSDELVESAREEAANT